MNNSLTEILNRLGERYKIYEQTGELDEDFDLEEENSGNSGGEYGTPNAFSKKAEDPDDASFTEPVHCTERFFQQIDDIYNRINVDKINELSYNNYKTDDSKSERQKINSNIIEINRKLREVEQMVNHASKLKLETGSDQSVFWKGTFNHFNKIQERLNKLSNKIREIST